MIYIVKKNIRLNLSVEDIKIYEIMKEIYVNVIYFKYNKIIFKIFYDSRFKITT